MPDKRVNVLIYSGPGASLSSVRHATWSLRRLLGPHYSIQTVSSDQILKEPWPTTCALLVLPGGADMGYCRMLNGHGNRRIKQYVQMGGRYLGLCAGGYYGSGRCEFEIGKKPMEVAGDRELAFFPGVCRGLAFEGFVYQSEAGARAVDLKVQKEAFQGTSTEHCKSYYNGGGAFVDAESFRERGVEILATFHDELSIDAGKAKAAVVYCKVGEGAAVLTGPHPEFAGINLNRNEPSNPKYGDLVDTLIANDKQRTDFMKGCLIKLGLEVSQEAQAVPSLSRLHLSCTQPSQVAELQQRWREAGIITSDGGEDLIKGEQDTFKVENVDFLSLNSLKGAVNDVLPEPVKDAAASVANAITSATKSDSTSKDPQADSSPDRILDYDALTKRLCLHPSSLPEPKDTPYFNHHAFYSNLQHYNAKQPGIVGDYGRVLLYGEVVTSTQSILDKNPTWLLHLPIGTTATATTQVSGRGRGTNVWVSPPGSLMFSTVLKHSLSLSASAPVIFVQYLAALAIVAGIQNYDRNYEKLPVKLKWPNDIYALDPSKDPKESSYVKIGGILVNSSYSGGDYTLIVGIGLNVANAAPTTSLTQLAAKLKLPPLTLEKLLASILSQFEALYARFCVTGFDQRLEKQYYASWLHSDQVVTLEAEGGAKARIKGITTDWGLLIAEELRDDGKTPTGRKWELQSDSNSFDFLRGLVRRKV
ncbi:Biotin-- ligase [Lecanosticta acicola]|uniref:Biotin-- ligase n=1 Tax=Lecanosticta acicola TaxID=111012 RepID=A0AAI9E8U2_9PEZI|nr:Biotin-- ligase [Lecanosticta acicola]